MSSSPLLLLPGFSILVLALSPGSSVDEEGFDEEESGVCCCSRGFKLMSFADKSGWLAV